MKKMIAESVDLLPNTLYNDDVEFDKLLFLRKLQNLCLSVLQTIDIQEVLLCLWKNVSRK